MEKRLLQGCIKGDRKIQKELYDLYSGQMYGICLRYCKNPAAATDALQLGFISVFNKIDKYRSDGSLVAWIRKIMVNSALNEIRKSKRFRVEDLDFSNDYGLLSTIELNIDDFDYQRLMDHIDLLPDGYRIVFSMNVFDDMTHKEIATVLEISENTSRSQLLRARKMLQQSLKADPYLSEQYLEKNKNYML